MREFDFVRAGDLSQAMTLAAAPDGVPIAGGTELLNLMREGIIHPARIFDLSGLADLARIEIDTASLRIGALARLSDIAADARVAGGFPAIATALLESASPQIRNMASLGGNLMQRTRCAYFRNGAIEVKCNKRLAGSGCAAISSGQARDFAAFGASETCIAVHPSDVAVALAACDAVVRLRSAGAERTLPVEDFIRLPAQAPQRDTELAAGELIVGVEIPVSGAARNSAYLKLRDRASYEFALVSAAAGVEIKDGRIAVAKLALGGVAHRPWRLRSAEHALHGVAVESAEIPAVLAAALKAIPARPGSAMKLELAGRTAARAIALAVQRA